MYTVKDCKSCLMNMNSITTPVYTAEKVEVDDDYSTYSKKMSWKKATSKFDFFNATYIDLYVFTHIIKLKLMMTKVKSMTTFGLV